MNLVSIEAPAARMAAAGEFPEFLDAALGIVAPSQLLQVVADQLIEALAKSVCLLSGTGYKLLVDRQAHSFTQYMCACILCHKELRLSAEFSRTTLCYERCLPGAYMRIKRPLKSV